MKYPFHIVDVFSSTPFGGNQLAVLPDAAGISTEGMQKIARDFNFGETTFVLPKSDAANTYRLRIFTPRAELDFAGHPSVGAACALVMNQHVRRRGAPVPPSSAPWHRSPSLAGRPIAFRSSKCLDGASKRDRSGGEQERSRRDLCQRWWCHGLHRQRRTRGAAIRTRALEHRVCPHARKPQVPVI